MNSTLDVDAPIPLVGINRSALGLTAVPEWVMLIPSGTFKGRDGRGPYQMTDVNAVIANTSAQALEAGLPFDINHSTDFSAPNGGPSPAAGWIHELQNRAGELWGRVEWTDLGKESLSRGPNGEPPRYRYLSPVFTFDNDGNIQELLRAALTNNPNLRDTAICHQEGSEQDHMESRTMNQTELAICRALGVDRKSFCDMRDRVRSGRPVIYANRTDAANGSGHVSHTVKFQQKG